MKYANIINKLQMIVGKNYVYTEKVSVLPYVYDASYFVGQMPLAVVAPRTANEVSKILKFCNDYKIPVYTRGAGTSLTGAPIPLGGIVLSMARFDKILEINVRDRYAIVEAGVRIDDLNLELSKYNYIYPIDPGSSLAATIGGTIATNAGGIRVVRYGSTKEWVMGVEAVLPKGEIVEFGERTLKRSVGYDLTALMVGSEGTLGVITKAILKITPMPAYTSMILLYYNDVKSVSDAIGILNENGLIPLVAECMNKQAMEITFKSDVRYYDTVSKWILIILTEIPDKTLEVLKQTRPLKYQLITDKNEINYVFTLRKRMRSSLLKKRTSVDEIDIGGDIIVPPSELWITLEEVIEIMQKHNIEFSPIFGHIGDGNIHFDAFINIKKDFEKAKSLIKETAMVAVKHNGCISAEHGIGLEKKDVLIEEFRYRNTLYNIELYRGIKKVFDPNGIMNRGKLFD